MTGSAEPWPHGGDILMRNDPIEPCFVFLGYDTYSKAREKGGAVERLKCHPSEKLTQNGSHM